MARRKLLIYSHDSFGLGHLRRCRSIALNLVDRFDDLEVMIVSGLPLISQYEFHPRVQIALVPQIIKQRDGDYRASRNGDLSSAIEQRAHVILDVALRFEPDVFLVDKEPLGIRGEVAPTLEALAERECRIVLGLRDVMDDPAMLRAEWERKRAVEAIDRYYDEVWIYGLPSVYEPLQGIPLPTSVTNRLIYTSYLRRDPSTDVLPEATPAGHLLVTPGGGGDGEDLVDQVLTALEGGAWTGRPVVIVSGPFMQADLRRNFGNRAATLPGVRLLEFVPSMETLVAGAAGIVAMGGYNTFCEILTFDKPAVIVPRTTPRLEQFIRAERAETLGLVRMLTDVDAREPGRMAEALRQLVDQPRPSAAEIPGLLDGHTKIAERMEVLLAAMPMLHAPRRRHLKLAGARA